MKKFTLLMTILAITILFCIFAFNVQSATENITKEDAELVAKDFIISNMEIAPRMEEDGDLKKHNVEEEKLFDNEITLTETEKLYNADQEISGYLVNFKNEEGIPGYIVVNADKEKSPIVEFSTSNEHPLDIAKENLDLESKAYNYLGGIDYAITDEKESYILEEGSIEKITKEDLENTEENLSNIEKEENKEEWETILENKSGSSNPPTGKLITRPADYESNWQDCTYDYCYKMGNNYFIMGDFPGYSKHCSPTAGTNLCKYWTLRDPDKFKKLKKNNKWLDTFKRLYKLMGTTNNGTPTPSYNVRYGITNYFNERIGNPCSTSSRGDCDTTSEFNDYIKQEINNGRPIAVILSDDEYYGNHSMVGFGYIRYKYNKKWKSHYVMVADGWTKTPDRYLHYQTGRRLFTVSRINPY